MSKADEPENYDVDPKGLVGSLTGERIPGSRDDSDDLRLPDNVFQQDEDGESTVVEPIEGLHKPPTDEVFMTTSAEPKSKKQPADVFKNLIPPSDRLLVYKIDPKGHKAYLASFGANDLARSQGIEAFIAEHLAPTYGPGEYIVEIRDMNGKIKKDGLVPIIGPVSPHHAEQKGPTLADLLSAQQQIQAQADRKAGEQLSNMNTMMAMFKEFMPKGEKGSGESMSMMFPMMMMMMQQQQQANQRPTGPDPFMQLLIQRLERMEQQPSLPPPIPLPFPPAPPPDQIGGAGMVELLKVILETVRISQHPQQSSGTIEAIISAVLPKLTQPDKNALTAKDLVELIPTLKDIAAPREGMSTFNDYLEGLMKLDEIRGGQSEGPSILAGLAEMVTGVIRDIKMQQMQLEAYQKIGKVPEQMRRSVQPERQFRPTIQPPLIQSQPVQQEQSEQEERRSKVPPIPVTFRKFAVEMTNAYKKKEHAKLMMAFLKGLMHLRDRSPEWSPYIEEMMLAAAEGNKERAIRFCEVFLYSFAKKKVLAPEVVAMTKKAFIENYEVIVQETGLSRALKTVEETIEQEAVPSAPEPVQTRPEEHLEAIETEDDEEEEEEVELSDIPVTT